jgi:hypothetical protein
MSPVPEFAYFDEPLCNNTNNQPMQVGKSARFAIKIADLCG